MYRGHISMIYSYYFKNKSFILIPLKCLAARDAGDANADIKLTEVTNEEEALDFNEV